jgi:hypothetical protein
MGNWSIHIEGAGIHDNGRDDDAEVMLERFAADLAAHHQVHSVTFTVGTTRELLNADETTPLDPERIGHAYRHRVH